MSDVNFSKLDKKQGAGGIFRPSILLISNALLRQLSRPDRAPRAGFHMASHTDRHDRIDGSSLGISMSMIAIQFLLAISRQDTLPCHSIIGLPIQVLHSR